jgi:hypothetical protein
MENLKQSVLIAHIKEYELNLIEYPSPDQSDIIQQYLNPYTFLSDNYNQILEHYEKHRN